MLLRKFKILIFALYGECIKLACRIELIRPKYGINNEEERGEKVVVSLTSYGRRVNGALYFTIISLLRQSFKPDTIVLWLDSDSWNDRNLPKRLIKLKKYGLTVRYCVDIKSYKKLVPSITAYPNDVIITCDDDIYYKRDMVKQLVEAWRENPTRVYTHRAHIIRFASDGSLMPYNRWEKCISARKGKQVFATGGGGCLYKRALLHEDICRCDLFMKLSPKADDVWFYFMELLAGTEVEVLPSHGVFGVEVDAFYQYFHSGECLENFNVKQSLNDSQIRAVMEYYEMVDEDLR